MKMPNIFLQNKIVPIDGKCICLIYSLMPLMFFLAHKYLSFLEVTQDFFAGIAILIWA